MIEKPSLLLVDDEERILRSLSMLFRANYQVQATTDPKEALALVARAPVHVVVSDQKMPLMRGAELLRQVRERSPSTMRILLTGYSEVDAVVASVNEGEIFRYIAKPWDAAELRASVMEAARVARRLFETPTEAVAVPDAAPSLQPIAVPGDVRPLLNAREGILIIDDEPDVYETVRELV